MDIRHVVGQRLCTGFSGTQLDSAFISMVRKHKIGNVILFGHNVAGRMQLHQLCADIQDLVLDATGYPAFITIDQEGGPVSRLPEGSAVFPSAMAIAATQYTQNAYDAGLLTGQELKALGINFNLAPVMDVNNNPRNPAIGVRSFGDTPACVGKYGVQMIRGLTEAGVLCAAKHFPGHGDTAVDSHVGLPCVDKTFEELLACELIGFQAAIDAGVPAIMASHILYPQLESESVPATMSRRIITGLLKEKLGFTGLVLSDCMMMGAIADHYGTVAGCLAAAKAGVDILFVSHSASQAGEAAHKLHDALVEGQLDMAEMEASAAKILALKKKVQGTPAPLLDLDAFDAHFQAAQRMAQEAATWVHLPNEGMPALGSSPLFIGCPPYRVNNASDPVNTLINFPVFMERELCGIGFEITADPCDEEIQAVLGKLHPHTCIVLGTLNAHLRTGQMKLMRAIAQTGLPMICVALRNPYDFVEIPAHVAALAVYGYDVNALHAAAGVLSGRIKAGGKLPVRL